MMSFRWSWIFTLTLLVQLGNANFPSNDDPFVNKLHRREELLVDTHSYVVSATPMSTKNVGIIVACVVGGLALSCAGLGYAYLSRSRRLRVPHTEEGMESPSSVDSTWKPKSNNLRSQFSPDETSGFDRIRAAFGKRKKREAILPVYNIPLPPGSVESIERPQPAAQGHLPRYPSILERGNSKRSFDSDTPPPPRKSPSSKRASPPPPLKGLPELARTPSSLSTLSGPRAQSKVSKRPQVPPKAVLVPPPGRPLPGLSGSKTAHTPKSPSKRRSWLSKHTFKHPFIPFRSPDISLKFPPGSPLGAYHPSRQHLEARFDMVTPRVSSPLAESPRRLPPASAKEVQRREHVIKRQPVPLLIAEPSPASARQAKIVEALHSAEVDGLRTPTGYRTALPATNTTKPLKTPKTPKTVRIAASPMRADSPVMPTTAYI